MLAHVTVWDGCPSNISLSKSITMATSIQTCLSNNACKHEAALKSSARSPNFLRYGYSSMPRPNSAHRKSAVERLEESKANYVKSECVLDSKQKFKHSSHLQVSTGPQLDVLRKGPLKHFHAHNVSPLKSQANFSIEDLEQQLQGVNCQEYIQQSLFCSKSQGPIRARAKSQSEVRDSQRRKLSFLSHGSGRSNDETEDLESQLKRLISSNSKENIVSSSNFSTHTSRIIAEGPKVRRGYSDPVKKDCSLTSRHVQERNYSIHKSLPDLSPSLHEPLGREATPSESSEDSLFWQERTELEESLSSCPASEYITKNSFNYNCLLDQEELFVECLQNDCSIDDIANGADTLQSLRRDWNDGVIRRNPVSRSKSDVSHRYSKFQSEHVPRRNSYCTAELERFFDMMGLDTMVWHNITSPTHLSSPPRFFDSVSSINSDDHRSSICSEDSFEMHREGLTNRDLREHGRTETSIVEKNARVIKWLYNCRKALKESGS